jgi:molybdopterin-synthase adenylyltransferase
VRGHGNLVVNEYLLRLHTEGLEITMFADGRTVIKGTDSPERARAVAARLLGT